MTSDFTLKIKGSSSPEWDEYFNDTHINSTADWENDEHEPLEDDYGNDSFEVWFYSCANTFFW